MCEIDTVLCFLRNIVTFFSYVLFISTNQYYVFTLKQFQNKKYKIENVFHV